MHDRLGDAVGDSVINARKRAALLAGATVLQAAVASIWSRRSFASAR
jgi:hypothetical protein